MHIDEAIERFREYLTSERELSRNTIEAYTTDLAQLSVHMHEKYGISVKLERVKIIDVRAFLAGQVKKGLGNRSMMRKVSSIRSFFRFATARSLITEDPTIYLAQQVKRRTIPTIVSEERITQMMELPDTEKSKGRRDRAILEFLYGTGVRLSEMVVLDIADFVPVGETVRVLGKGDKERMVPFGGKAKSALFDYWRVRFGLRGEPTGRVLSSYIKEPAFSTDGKRRISARTVQRIVEKYFRRVASISATSPHTLRHAFATHLLDNGADLRAVQEFWAREPVYHPDIHARVEGTP